ncbi:MAG: response regulator [Gemmatimonadaceae bacterium]
MVDNTPSPPSLQQARVRQADMLESIGRLAGGIAHDFNNLLTSILGYAELLDGQLQQRGNLDAERSDLKEIRLAAERARELTQRLLAFSRRLPISPRIVDVNMLVTGMERLLKKLVGNAIELSLVLSAQTGTVVADPTQLEQLLLSLAVNATDAMPAGGTLTVRSRRRVIGVDESFDGVVIGKGKLARGEYLEISVSDTGAGMTPEFVHHAFEPFVTTKLDDPGSGLGLSTVYGLVTQARGAVVVNSVVGRGTVVQVLLPLVHESVDDFDDEIQEDVVGGSEVILLADDDADVRTLNARTLREAGYEVITADDGESALELAAEHGQRIDLIVTDVVMPKRNGWEVAEAIQARRPDARILFVSGFAPTTLTPLKLPERGIPFLAKPFTPSTLLSRVRALLDASPKMPSP